MKGFDPRFRDLPDYILGITKEIWEDRGIATLRQYYAPTMAVRSPSGIVFGNEGVIAATLATLAEFPDRTLLGEDVIWCGDEEAGFLSSHRILSTATHSGDGAYGPATGRQLRYRIIADCYAHANQICDEWLVRDQGAVVRQMGFDPKRYAAERIAAEGEGGMAPLTPATDLPGPYGGAGNADPLGMRYADILSGLMAGDIASIPAVYDRAVQIEMPAGLTGHGWAAADAFWMRLRSAFPSAEFRIHHRIGREDALLPPRAALRWSLWGKHDGFGAFGPPSGAPVYVLGISHAEFGPRGLRREWVLYDEPRSGRKSPSIRDERRCQPSKSSATASFGHAGPLSSTPIRRGRTRRRTSPSSAAASRKPPTSTCTYATRRASTSVRPGSRRIAATRCMCTGRPRCSSCRRVWIGVE